MLSSLPLNKLVKRSPFRPRPEKLVKKVFQNTSHPTSQKLREPVTPQTLRKIRDLLQEGLTYDEIEPKLDIIDPTDSDKALLTLAEFNQVLE